MYNTETEFILLMLGISDAQYKEALYGYAEKWEDKNDLTGIYGHRLFRSWWILRSNNLNKLFFHAIGYSDGKMMLHLKNDTGYQFIYNREAIRRHYWAFLRKRLVNTPFDNALLELIHFKTKKVKQS